MCGIAGSLSLVGDLSPLDVAVVGRINQHQRRRGPDGEGITVSRDKRVALGHRRLAIIDIGVSGAQPMSDATGRWTITFNGEIYNYRVLRKELEYVGRRFRTDSDTEVLINAIAEWGEMGLRKLRGMFAFALWDDEKKELWLARDSFGVKPLYYADTGSRLWFASQARALAECATVSTKRQPAGLVGFCLWGAVPDPFTWWQGVSALPAGHVLRIVPGQAVPTPRQFLAIEDCYTAAPANPISPKELRKALRDSVANHFVADVTVGVFLSAGVDSTALAVLAKELGFKLHTVTLAFDEFKGTADDEAPIAEETARLLSADHQTVRVSRDECLALFDDFMASMDQPTIDGLNTYLISRAAASVGLKVALSGIGGDELFGGYPSFTQVPKLVSIGSKIPARALLGNALYHLGRPITHMFNASPKLAASLKYAGDIENAHFLRRCLYLPEELDMLVDENWRKLGFDELAVIMPGGDAERCAGLAGLLPHAAVSRLELTNYLRMQPLRDTDWASMANSIEVRVPFLDLPLFEKVAPAIASSRPPAKLDIADCVGPAVTRVASRPKTGFSTPVATWVTDSLKRGRGLRPWADRVSTFFGNIPPTVV